GPDDHPVRHAPSRVSARRPPAGSPLLPYTTLFRSRVESFDYILAVRHMQFKRLADIAHVQRWHKRHRRRADPFSAQISPRLRQQDRKSTRLNSSHVKISYAVFCLKTQTKPLCALAP